jgi:flagellar hook-associated protein 1 FlgK
MGFGGLTIATSGLRAAQRNLNITGHNIANSEVPGFSRQRIIQVSANQRMVGVSNAGSRMQVGMGTDWSEVHHIRNEFLDVNYRNNVSQLQFYSTKVAAGLTIENIMGELHGAYNFQSVLNDMWNAIQELTSMPDALHTRQFFLATANTFLVKSQEVFNSLVEYQTNLDNQIREIVTGRQGINATVSAIADYNLLIRQMEAGGERANDYRDERHRLLDHLATMIPIDITTSPNGEINITSMGHHLLTGTTQSMMGLRHISREATFVEPVFTFATDILSAGTPPSEFTSYLNYLTPINADNGNDLGALLGLLQARGTSPANHMSADVIPPPSLMDLNRAIQIVQDLNVGTTGNFIQNINAVIATTTDPVELEDLQFVLALARRDINNFVPRIANAEAAIPPNPALVVELREEMVRDFHAQTHNHRAHMWSIQNAMIPQVQMNLDRIVNSVVTMINDALTGNLRGSDGQFIFYEKDAAGNAILDANGNRIPIRPQNLNQPPDNFGAPLFIRAVDTDSATPEWPLIANPENPNDVMTVFTINNIRINPAFREAGGHNNLALSLSGALGDTDLLVALQKVWMADNGHYSIQIGDRRLNVQDAYIRFTGAIATETSDASNRVSSQTIQVDHAQNMRMAIKGVSMDEEMSAMLRFQFAFQAASRAFNMIDQMIDRIVNGTGRVGI